MPSSSAFSPQELCWTAARGEAACGTQQGQNTVRNSEVLYQDLQWQVKLRPPTTFCDGTTSWVSKGRAGDATSPDCSQIPGVISHIFI